MIKNSIIHCLEEEVNRMKDEKLKGEANKYLDEARNHELALLYATSGLREQGFLTTPMLSGIRYYSGAMHSAIRCARALIKDAQDQTQTET